MKYNKGDKAIYNKIITTQNDKLVEVTNYCGNDLLFNEIKEKWSKYLGKEVKILDILGNQYFVDLGNNQIIVYEEELRDIIIISEDKINFILGDKNG